MSTTITKKSVFELEYIPYTNTTTNAESDYTKVVYFKQKSESDNDKFWQFVLYSYSEVHQESMCQADTLSDAILMHSTGAMPINITMQGFFAKGYDLDMRDTFLNKYTSDYNAKALKKKDSSLIVCVRNTTFNFFITQIVSSETTTTEDYSQLTISGIAYNYKTGNSKNSVNDSSTKTDAEKKEDKSIDEVQKAINELSAGSSSSSAADVSSLPTAISIERLSSYSKDESLSYYPMTTMYTADYSGRAAVLLSSKSVNLDLLVDSLNCKLGDFNITEPHIGDTFGNLFLGKEPAAITISGTIPDTKQNYGKEELINLYLSNLRLYAVAKTGVTPILRVAGMAFHGPWTSLSISEKADTQDLIFVSIGISVNRVCSLYGSKVFDYDFVHGIYGVKSN